MSKSELFSLIIVVVSFLIGVFVFAKMPDSVAVHWSAKGQVNGYMPKFWGVFSIPFLLFGLWIVFLLLPRIDPLKDNLKKFKKYFDWFIFIIFLFLFLIYLQIIIWNLNIAKISPFFVVLFGLAVLLFFVGLLCEKSKRNWFVGVRTPWTLSDDNVWEKTNKIAGKFFKLSSLFAVLGLFFVNYALYFVFIPLGFIVIFSFVYSWWLYQAKKD